MILFMIKYLYKNINFLPYGLITLVRLNLSTLLLLKLLEKSTQTKHNDKLWNGTIQISQYRAQV